MLVERAFAPHAGAYTPSELDFLQSIVREAIQNSKSDHLPVDIEAVAHAVFQAYKRGTMDHDELVQVAKRAW